jgi:gliding motility-associated-like protein
MKFCNHDMSRLSSYRFTKIQTFLILLVVCILPQQKLYSQHTTRDNYTGYWEDSITWDPTWSSPQNFISGYDITVNGYVTVEGSLGFYSLATKLIVNDTLVIKGNLYLHNNNDLIVNDRGVLIIRGNLWIEEHSNITTNGYLIITRDIHKDNNRHFGSFISNDNPPKVFIGGSVNPEEITVNFPNYPVLNCSSPLTVPYQNSGCSSGNMNDMEDDSVYPFFLSTCNIYSPSSSVSVCPGDSIHLTATGGLDYNWNGPANFRSEMQNPSLPEADSTMSGIYTVHVMADYDCEATDTIHVIVNPFPEVSITNSDDPLCVNDQRTLTGSPAGGVFKIDKGPGVLDSNILKPSGTGKIQLEYLYNGVCSNKATQTIISYPLPYPYAGSDQELNYHFETKLEGSLLPYEKGTWTVLSGSGQIEDIYSPVTNITGLSPGENVFLWTVSNGTCEAGSQVRITVLDLVVPTVFTPNDDGINDLFYISNGGEPFEITVFNQWGIIEYESHSYAEYWDGRNNKGNTLPPETYFYVLKFENGLSKKGSVLIVR